MSQIEITQRVPKAKVRNFHMKVTTRRDTYQAYFDTEDECERIANQLIASDNREYTKVTLNPIFETDKDAVQELIKSAEILMLCPEDQDQVVEIAMTIPELVARILNYGIDNPKHQVEPIFETIPAADE